MMNKLPLFENHGKEKFIPRGLIQVLNMAMLIPKIPYQSLRFSNGFFIIMIKNLSLVKEI